MGRTIKWKPIAKRPRQRSRLRLMDRVRNVCKGPLVVRKAVKLKGLNGGSEVLWYWAQETCNWPTRKRHGDTWNIIVLLVYDLKYFRSNDRLSFGNARICILYARRTLRKELSAWRPRALVFVCVCAYYVVFGVGCLTRCCTPCSRAICNDKTTTIIRTVSGNPRK